MQVSATLIAAQQAAREAQARFHASHVAPPAPSGFSAALEKTGAPDSFAPLPWKQTAAPRASSPVAPPPSQPGARLGSMLDVTI